MQVWRWLRLNQRCRSWWRCGRILLGVGIGVIASLGIAIASPQSQTSVMAGEPIVITQASSALNDLVRAAETHYANGQYAQARDAWQTVAEALKTDPRSSLQEVRALSNLSLSHQQLGAWPQAEAAIQQAFRALGLNPDSTNLQPQSQETQYLLVLAQTADIRGQLAYVTGSPEVAFNLWRQTQDIYQLLEHHSGAVGSGLNQAQAYQALGQYLRAQESLAQVKALLPTDDSQLRITFLQNLAQTERSLGNLEAALEDLQDAIDLATTAAPALLAQLRLEQGHSYRAIAIRQAELGQDPNAQIEQAWQSYATAVSLSSNDETPAARLTQLQARLSQLRLQARFAAQVNTLSNNIPATRLIQEIDSLFQNPQLPFGRTTLFAEVLFAKVLMEQAPAPTQLRTQAPAIATLLGDAIYRARSLGDKRGEAEATGTFGQLYQLLGQESDASDLTQEAIKLSTEAQAPDLRYRWHRQLGALLEQQGQRASALNAYRAATEDLGKVRFDLLAVDSQVQFSFRDTVEPVYREFIELLIKTADASDQASPEFQAYVNEALQRFDELQLAEINNFLGCESGRKIRLDLVDDPKSVIVYAITLSDRIAVILDLPGASNAEPRQKVLLSHEILRQETADTEDLLAVIDNFRESASSDTRRGQALEFSQAIYRRFFQPIAAVIQGFDLETLVFVLDGDLRNISLAALADEQGHFLIEHYNLAITPGLDLFEPQPLSPDLTVLLGGRDTEVSERVADQRVSPIPRLEEELAAIRQWGTVSKTLVGEGFTASNIRESLLETPYSAVHFKTHGQFSSDPQETFIFGFNELIRGRELGNLIQAGNPTADRFLDLLTLSACQAAAGDNRAVLGMTGVAVRAGARSIVSALWDADYRITIDLMTRFYQKLYDPDTPYTTRAEALRAAQMELIANGESIYKWAPYILVGNWQ